LPAAAAEAIRNAARVIAVGTTTVRVLESVAAGAGGIREAEGRTNLFIRPPHEFRAVGGLLTNFHLPKSTLMMLVAAFAGRENVLAAYAEAIRQQYRFYSYGDCMLVV
jgi:S-adenosylmethionine:tRNA ribosyltransferase-isomerase